MEGRDGNDTHYIDNTKDVVIEQAGGGEDTVFSSISPLPPPTSKMLP